MIIQLTVSFFNLGLIRFIQSCPTETIEELMLKKVEEFGLTFGDIVAATTDDKIWSRFILQFWMCSFEEGLPL